MASASKRVLLVHPLGVNWVPGEPDMSRIANIMPPIGLVSLAAWLERHGHRTDVHDCYAFPGQDEAIDEYVRGRAPDYVGFTATTSSFLDAVRIAGRVKQLRPQVRTVFGGVHVSALREQLLADYPEIDYGVIGEGEEPLLALLDRDGDGLREVPGLLFREAGEVVSTGWRKSTLDLDSLPFPAYGKLVGYPRAYQLPIFSYPRAPGTTVVSSRGCPYQCTYCDRSVFRRSFRSNSAAYMVELLAHLRRSFGIHHVNFYDDLFTFSRERVEAFCEGLLGSNLKVTFNCAARAEHVDRELLRLMKRAGCWMVSLGIESGDETLLSRHRSAADLEAVRERIRWIKESGLRAKGLFMLGLPGETEETAAATLDLALSLPLDDVNLAKFTPFPGSPLYRKIREHGAFEENWPLMNCLNFVFVPHGLTRARLDQLYRQFYRRYFERPAVLLRYAAMVRHSPDSWRRLLHNLKDFLSIRRIYRS